MSLRPVFSCRWSAAFTLLLLLLGALWLAGGASHADVMGQVVTRCAAWLILVLAILCGVRPAMVESVPIFWFLLAAVLLVLLQLVPLPPRIWAILPGRGLLLDTALGHSTWRPWSMVPWATINAASSLIVPVVALYLVSALRDEEKGWVPAILLGFVSLSMLIGIFQFSGLVIDNPLVGGAGGGVSGTFANRNHFALLLAMGCLIGPVWAFSGNRGSGWRTPVALALVSAFALTILATGSRAGILTGLLALMIGLTLSWHHIRHAARSAPRWVFPLLIAGVVGMVAIFILISIAADRAESVRRALELDPGLGMRARGLPTVLSMIATYFPAGIGFGGFDPIFRIHEPLELLKRTYFNHAHNDFLEIVLDGGLPALLLLLTALGWYAWASVKAWRMRAERCILPRLGSVMLLLVFVASAFDYPARTPIIMAIIVIAGAWLSQGATDSRSRFTKLT